MVVAPDYGTDTVALDRERPYPIERFPGRHCSMVSPRKLFRYARLLHELLPRLDPDLVHAVCPASQMAVTLLSRVHRLPAPFGFTVHGTELIRYRHELLPRLWMTGAFRRPAGIAVVSEAVRERLLDGFPVPEGRSFVSHPGIGDAWHALPPAPRSEVRAAWGAREDDFVILTVARRVPEKGHDRVVNGTAALPESSRNRIVYVVAGTGPEEYALELEDLAARRGVRITLLGEVPDAELVNACDGADLFAMLSRETPKRLEGFGLTYIEAGRRGVPSIACRTGGVAEAVRHEETGLLLPQDPTPDQTAGAIARFLDDEAFRRRTGDAARSWASRFTHRRHAQEVYSRFAELADG